MLLSPGQQVPDGVESVQVQHPADHDAAGIAALVAAARRGVTVVVVDPPATSDWADAIGADPNDHETHGEVVVDPTDAPAARNLASTVLPGGARTFVPRDGTTTLLTQNLRFNEVAVATLREVGAGRVLALGREPGTSDVLDPDPVRVVLDRTLRGVVPRDREVGLGVVGYGQHGGMGWLHGTSAEAVAGLRLAGIAETVTSRRDDAGDRFPEAALYDDLDLLLQDDDVEVVVVATPPSTHHKITRLVLEAGRHVVVEKPLCFTAAEADDLLAVADDVDRTLTVHQNRRWDPDFRAVRRLIASGRLGDVFNVETFVGGFEHPCRLWHSELSVSGGRLYDWGAHLIDQTMLLLGDTRPAEVSATGHGRVWDDVTNLDQVRVRLRYDDGREAEFLDSDVLAVRRPKYLVQGTRGTLVGDYRPVVEERVTRSAGHERVEHHHAEAPAELRLALHEPGWGLHESTLPPLAAEPQAFHRRLADHLQLGDPVPVPAAEIRDVTAVLEAAHASAHGGGTARTPA